MWNLIGSFSRHLIVRVATRLSCGMSSAYRDPCRFLSLISGTVIQWFGSLSLLTNFEVNNRFCSLLTLVTHLLSWGETRMNHTFIKVLHVFAHESSRVLFLMIILCAKIVRPIHRKIAATSWIMSVISDQSIRFILLIDDSRPQGPLILDSLVRWSSLEAWVPLGTVFIGTLWWWWFKSSQSLLSEADHYF